MKSGKTRTLASFLDYVRSAVPSILLTEKSGDRLSAIRAALQLYNEVYDHHVTLQAAEDQPYWVDAPRSDSRMEWQCPHGVGHGNHVHGCDGCCQRTDYPGLQALRRGNPRKPKPACYDPRSKGDSQ